MPWLGGWGESVGLLGGMVYYVLNRGVGRQTLFRKPADYAAFAKLKTTGSVLFSLFSDPLTKHSSNQPA